MVRTTKTIEAIPTYVRKAAPPTEAPPTSVADKAASTGQQQPAAASALASAPPTEADGKETTEEEASTGPQQPVSAAQAKSPPTEASAAQAKSPPTEASVAPVSAASAARDSGPPAAQTAPVSAAQAKEPQQQASVADKAASAAGDSGPPAASTGPAAGEEADEAKNQEEKMAETTVNEETKKTVMAMDEVARKEVINKSNLTRILYIIYNETGRSENDIRDRSPMEEVFKGYIDNLQSSTMPQYILMLMRKICNTRLNITQDEIKIQLILSIILLKLYENDKRKETDTKKGVITENWDRVSTYVDTVIKKDHNDSNFLYIIKM